MNEDERYMRIVKYMETNWPPYHTLDDLCKMLYKYRDTLHVENGLLFKDHHLVIPIGLQKSIQMVTRFSHGRGKKP